MDCKIDLRSYLSQHDIAFHSPINGWQNGLPLGNGDLAAIAYSEGKDYVLGITKIDVWDMRFKRRKPLTPHNKILELIERRDWDSLNSKIYKEENKSYDKDPYPNPKPCGELKIKGIFSSGNGDYEGRLSLYDGIVTCRTKSTESSSFIHAGRNLLVVRCKGKRDGRIRLEFIRSKDKALGKPDIGSDGRYFWVDYAFPDGFRYVMMGSISEARYETRRSKDGISILINLSETGAFCLCLSVSTSMEAKNTFQKAKEIVEYGLSLGYTELLYQHTNWWHSFWGKSFIDIPDKFLENLWYYQLYLLASSSRGIYPVPSGCHLWDMKDTKPWHADYHTNDIAIIYWSIFASNHLELGEPLYKNFFEVLPLVKQETEDVFGINGLKYAFSPMPTGQEIAGGYWRYEIYGSAWIGQMFWWYYLYSLDKKFLREKAYPVIKGVLSFYEGYLRKDKNGRYYIFPCHPVEQMPPNNADKRTTNWEKNVLIELAMLKALLVFGIKAGKILQKDEKKRKKWKNILDNLSKYPNNGDVFLEYEGAPVDFLVHHVDMLSPVFPCGEIGIDSPEKIYEMARKTFETVPYHTIRKDPNPPFPILTWRDEMNWCWLACIAARLGLGDEARKYIYDMGILFHLKNNGLFSIGFGSQHPKKRKEDTMSNMKSNTGLGMAINEMLIQSYDGNIRVFPAIPEDWKDCRFANLRTAGAFLVSSELSGGTVKYITVESLAGGKCSLVNPWNREDIKVWDAEKKRVIKESKNKTIKFVTKKGKVYLIKKSTEDFKNFPRFAIRSREKICPREYRGPRYLAKVEEDKTWLVQLGN